MSENVLDSLAKQQSRGLGLRTAASLLAEPMSYDWLIKDYFEQDCLIQLIGEPEAGKSLLALEWAASIASGEPWRGHDVRQGSVIYILGEGGKGFKRRMAAWETQNSPLADDVPLLVSKYALGIPSEVWIIKSDIEHQAEIFGNPALIVIDTLARAIEGDENSQKDMGAFIQGCDELRQQYRCAVLIVHHSGHGEAKRGRGSSSLPAAVDVGYLMTKTSDGRELKCTKSKDIEPPKPLYFRVEGITLPNQWKDADGSSLTAPVLVAEAAPTCKRTKLTQAQQTGMDSFNQVAGEAGSASLDDWRPRFYSMSTADNQAAKKTAFQRVRKDLVECGALVVMNNIYSKPAEHGTWWNK
jgi:hypothetical protein